MDRRHGSSAALIAVAVVTFRTVPAEFTPRADVGRGFVALEGPEGRRFEYMDRYARELEAIAFKEMEKGDIERFHAACAESRR